MRQIVHIHSHSWALYLLHLHILQIFNLHWATLYDILIICLSLVPSREVELEVTNQVVVDPQVLVI